MKPNFFIAGTAKSGTTSLYQYLAQHPQVGMSSVKEPNFFTTWEPDDLDSLERYYHLFDNTSGALAIGEASGYFTQNGAIQRIYRVLPESRFVVVLRDPSDRLFSHFIFHVQIGKINHKTYKMICLDEKELASYMLTRPQSTIGLYYRHVKKFLDVFGRDHLKIVWYEDFCSEPLCAVDDVFGFIGVDPTFKPDLSMIHNKTGLPVNRFANHIDSFLRPSHHVIKSALRRVPQKMKEKARRIIDSSFYDKPAMDPALRSRLVDFYRDDINKLERLVEKDLSHWLN